MAGSLSSNLITYLRTISSVTDLVGTGTAARIFERRARPGAQLPYIVLEQFEGTSHEHLGGISGMARQRMQIDCYGQKGDDAFDLAEKVRLAPLQGQQGLTVGTLDVREVSSPGGYQDGEDRPPTGSGQNRFWVTRDYFFMYREATS